MKMIVRITGLIAYFMLAAVSFAQDTAPTLEELREAADLCWKHSAQNLVRDSRTGILRSDGSQSFEPGWEDCKDITAAYVNAKAADTSADRQRLNDMKKRLGQ